MFSMCLILLGILSWSFYDVPDTVIPGEIFFQIGTQENAEQIRCWENDENTVYVFLPGYAEFSDISIQTEKDVRCWLDGTEVFDGDSCTGYNVEQVYEMTMQSGNSRVQKELIFVRSGQVPTLYIDVQSGSMEYIHMDKNNKETGSVRLYGSDGEPLHSGNLEMIKGRGNSSWGVDKKPYSLTLDQNADLLGMGAAQRWILLAEGFCTSVNFRNKIVYDYAQKVGMQYTPKGEWVDLYLNGEYAGLYLLSERNEINPERIDIDPETSSLVSMEWDIRLREQKLLHIVTDAGQALRVHHSSVALPQLDAQWQSVENAILAEDGIDPVSGKSWLELIDLDSWASKYLLEEVFGNHDGGSFSQFYYFDASQNKIYAGPIWDYDMAMGGYDSWLKNYPQCLIMNREYKEDGLYTPWFHALYKKDEFRQRVEELYQIKFLPAMKQLLESDLSETISAVWPAFAQNAVRWGFYQEEVRGELDFIHDYLTKRSAFLEDMWVNGTQYQIVRVDPGREEVYGHIAVKTGEQLPELHTFDSYLNLGWHTVETDEPFDVEQPIYEDVQIYMKEAAFQIPKIHYVPFLTMTLMILGLVCLDGMRSKRNRKDGHGAATEH